MLTKTTYNVNNLSSIKKQFMFYSTEPSDLAIKSLKIKEAVRIKDEKLFDPDAYRGSSFSSVAGDSIVFSQDFIGSLDFFGLVYPELAEGFLCQDKNEHIDNQHTKQSRFINP